MGDLHQAALLHEEEILALGPCVLGGVGVYSRCDETAVQVVLLAGYWLTAVGILRIVQKVVVVRVLLGNALLKQLIKLFEVG